jgi:hypothetical protein
MRHDDIAYIAFDVEADVPGYSASVTDEKRIAPTLSNSNREQAIKVLKQARSEIRRVSDGDADVEYNLNRFVYKRLQDDERGPISERRRFRNTLWARQGGCCAFCQKPFSEIDLVDKHHPSGLRYTAENTVLGHRDCHADHHRQEGTARERD